MSQPQAYLNGQFVPQSEASVPFNDAGFVLGATITEQLRTFAGRLFRLENHLARLSRSLRITGIDPGCPIEELGNVACELTGRNHPLLEAGDDLGLCIFVTPGPYASFNEGNAGAPTVGMHTYPLPFGQWADKYTRGESLVVSSIQQISPRSWPAELKCRSRIHYYLADQESAAKNKEPGARPLLLDAAGHVTETSTASIVVFSRARKLIAPKSEKVLPGISLTVVRELAERLELGYCEQDLTPREVGQAGEMIITSTPFCLLPVVRLDGEPIGNGRPGEVFGRLLAAWNELVGLDITVQAGRFAHPR